MPSQAYEGISRSNKWIISPHVVSNIHRHTRGARKARTSSFFTFTFVLNSLQKKKKPKNCTLVSVHKKLVRLCSLVRLFAREKNSLMMDCTAQGCLCKKPLSGPQCFPSNCCPPFSLFPFLQISPLRFLPPLQKFHPSTVHPLSVCHCPSSSPPRDMVSPPQMLLTAEVWSSFVRISLI